MHLNYVIARLIPDLVREEAINVGVILQSSERTVSRFIDKIPKVWGLDDTQEAIAKHLNKEWTSKLAESKVTIFLPENRETREIALTDPQYLDWLRRTYTRHLTFSDVRGAEVVIRDDYDYSQLLDRLFSMFVAPKPRLRKPIIRSRLHTAIRHDFRQQKLPLGNVIKEQQPIFGNFPWTVDFAYNKPPNGRVYNQQVAIEVLDLRATSFLERAKEILAAWSDVREVLSEDVFRVSVIGGPRQSDEHERAVKMLWPHSNKLYIYEEERDAFIQQIHTDLGSRSNGKLALR